MPRYIDAYKIPYHDLSDGRGKCEVAFLEDIIKVPTADVRENIKGEWIHDEITRNGNTVYIPNAKCSVCDCYVFQESNFCPSCGADMRRR